MESVKQIFDQCDLRGVSRVNAYRMDKLRLFIEAGASDMIKASFSAEEPTVRNRADLVEKTVCVLSNAPQIRAYCYFLLPSHFWTRVCEIFPSWPEYEDTVDQKWILKNRLASVEFLKYHRNVWKYFPEGLKKIILEEEENIRRMQREI